MYDIMLFMCVPSLHDPVLCQMANHDHTWSCMTSKWHMHGHAHDRSMTSLIRCAIILFGFKVWKFDQKGTLGIRNISGWPLYQLYQQPCFQLVWVRETEQLAHMELTGVKGCCRSLQVATKPWTVYGCMTGIHVFCVHSTSGVCVCGGGDGMSLTPPSIPQSIHQ